MVWLECRSNISFLLPVWSNWGNGNNHGMTNGEKVCNAGKYITEINWYQKYRYGLVNVWFKCNDGQTHWGSNGALHDQGSETRNIQCANGFDRIIPREQNNYGIIDASQTCVGNGHWERAKWDYSGHDNDIPACQNGQKITGIQLRAQDNYGLVNVRVLCGSV